VNDITMYPAGVLVALTQPTWFVFLVFVMWTAIAVYIVRDARRTDAGQ
jgi:hypothetical protein